MTTKYGTGKSLKGILTSGDGTVTTVDVSNLLSQSSGSSLENITIQNSSMFGGLIDDVVIGSISPNSATFSSLILVGNSGNSVIEWYPSTETLVNTGISEFGNLRIKDNTISAINVNGDIQLTPNGKGNIILNNDIIQGPEAGNVSLTASPVVTINSTTGDSTFGSLSSNTNIISPNGNTILENTTIAEISLSTPLLMNSNKLTISSPSVLFTTPVINIDRSPTSNEFGFMGGGSDFFGCKNDLFVFIPNATTSSDPGNAEFDHVYTSYVSSISPYIVDTVIGDSRRNLIIEADTNMTIESGNIININATNGVYITNTLYSDNIQSSHAITLNAPDVYIDVLHLGTIESQKLYVNTNQTVFSYGSEISFGDNIVGISSAKANDLTLFSSSTITFKCDSIQTGYLSIYESLDDKQTHLVPVSGITIDGNLTVNGKSTYITSTNTSYTDSIISLGVGSTTGDVKDRGVEFLWWTTQSGILKYGFMGFDQSSCHFKLIQDGTNVCEKYSGLLGILDVNGLNTTTLNSGGSALHIGTSAVVFDVEETEIYAPDNTLAFQISKDLCECQYPIRFNDSVYVEKVLSMTNCVNFFNDSMKFTLDSNGIFVMQGATLNLEISTINNNGSNIILNSNTTIDSSCNITFQNDSIISGNVSWNGKTITVGQGGTGQSNSWNEGSVIFYHDDRFNQDNAAFHYDITSQTLFTYMLNPQNTYVGNWLIKQNDQNMFSLDGCTVLIDQEKIIGLGYSSETEFSSQTGGRGTLYVKGSLFVDKLESTTNTITINGDNVIVTGSLDTSTIHDDNKISLMTPVVEFYDGTTMYDDNSGTFTIDNPKGPVLITTMPFEFSDVGYISSDNDEMMNIVGKKSIRINTVSDVGNIYVDKPMRFTNTVLSKSQSSFDVSSDVPISFSKCPSVTLPNILFCDKDVTIDVPNIFITGNMIVDKKTSVTIESEKNFDSGVIILGGTEIYYIKNVSSYNNNNTLITISNQHHLIVGDVVIIVDTDGMDGTYNIVFVPDNESMVIDLTYSSDYVTSSRSTVHSKLTENPGYDVGVNINWNTGDEDGTSSYRTGFFGFRRSSERFSFIAEATESSLGVFTGNSLGNSEFNTVFCDTISSDKNNVTFECGVTFENPFDVCFSSIVKNLNAEMLNGKTENEFVLSDGTRTLNGDWDVGAHTLMMQNCVVKNLLSSSGGSLVMSDVSGKLISCENVNYANGILSTNIFECAKISSNIDFGGNNITNAKISLSSADFTNCSVTFSEDQIPGSVIFGDISGTSGKVVDGLYRSDFNVDNCILKADKTGEPISLLIPVNSIIGRTTDDITTIPLTSIIKNEDYNEDDCIMKADSKGDPCVLEINSDCLIGRIGNSRISSISISDVVKYVSDIDVYSANALMRDGCTPAHPEGGIMTSNIYVSYERINMISGQTVQLNINVDTSYITVTSGLTQPVATLMLQDGNGDGQRKTLIFSSISTGTCVRTMLNVILTEESNVPTSLIFNASGQTATFQWDTVAKSWFVIGGTGCFSVKDSDFNDEDVLKYILI